NCHQQGCAILGVWSWKLPRLSLEPRPQYLRNAPRLRDAATRREWVLRIENFADRSDAVLRQMMLEAGKAFARPREITRRDPQIRVNLRTRQPGPHRSLMVGGDPNAQNAVLLRFEVTMSRSERRKDNGRHDQLPN